MPDKQPPRSNKRAMLGTFLMASIAYIVLGIFMVAKPQAVADGLNDVFGVVMLIYGIITIIAFFLNKDSEENLFLELATGVIAIGLGIFSLLSQDLMQKILFYVIGGVLIIDALVNIKRAVNLRMIGFPRWGFFLIAAIIGTLLGVVCIIFYSAVGKTIVVLFGISLIYEGAVSLLTIFFDARTRKKIKRSIIQYEQNRPID